MHAGLSYEIQMNVISSVRDLALSTNNYSMNESAYANRPNTKRYFESYLVGFPNDNVHLKFFLPINFVILRHWPVKRGMQVQILLAADIFPVISRRYSNL